MQDTSEGNPSANSYMDKIPRVYLLLLKWSPRGHMALGIVQRHHETANSTRTYDQI
jgi:hypothetical protein